MSMVEELIGWILNTVSTSSNNNPAAATSAFTYHSVQITAVLCINQ